MQAEASFSSPPGTPPRTVIYEVAVRRAGRWEHHASHLAEARGAALAMARDMDCHPGVEAVTVTKETCYHDSEAVAEIVIWRSAALEREQAAARARKPRYAHAHADIAARTARLAAPRPGTIAVASNGQRLAAMVGSFALACGAGAIAVTLLSAALSPASAANADGGGIESALATSVFLAATAGAFVMLARRLVPRRAPDAAPSHGRDLRRR
ncbi:MAG: hypothetical protein AB7N54_17560 [Alphaproteobacteria bacterium]